MVFVVLAAVFAYFAIVVLCVALVIFPDCRARFISALWGIAGIGAYSFRATRGFAFGLRWGYVICRRAVNAIGEFVRASPLLTGAAFCLILVPSMLALIFRGPTLFELAEHEGVTDRQILVLLQGEQLVPPPSLPPEVFTTQEVEMLRPDVIHASRNWGLLDREFTQRLLLVFKLMKERHGYDMVLIEGYRSPERQAQLFEQGGHVTQVGANMSYHQYGLAADSAFFRDGKIVISERDSWAMRGYQLYGEVAAQVGLTWGGNWKMQDYGHVELRRKDVLGKSGVR